MTLDLADHPMLREAASAPPQMVADFLTDQGAILGDVLALVIGEPPFAKGLPNAVLAEWLRANKPCRVCAPPANAEWLWEAVAALNPLHFLHSVPPCEEAARRDMLRQILPWFGDEPVRVVRRSRLLQKTPGRDIAGYLVEHDVIELEQGKFLRDPRMGPLSVRCHDRCYVAEQMVPARLFLPSERRMEATTEPLRVGASRSLPRHLGLLPRRAK